MVDLLYVLITLVFFAVCVLLVRGCDILIGEDEDGLDESISPTTVTVAESDSLAKVNS